MNSTDDAKGFKYYRPAWRAKEQYKSTLKIEDNVTLWFFINCRELITHALQEGTAHTGKSPGDILELLIQPDPGRFTAGETPLPMWGVKKDINIRKQQINDIGAVQLLRSVASVDITIEVETAVFELRSATLFYAASHSYPAPLPENFTDIREKDPIPSVPGISTFDVELRYTKPEENAPGDNKIRSKLYLYENDNRIHPTRVVIGGYYKGDHKPTYYPLDFREGNRILPVRRNYQYSFNITSVSGTGYASKREAKEAAAVNMDYEVIQWNRMDDTDIGIDGPWYFSIGSRKANLYNRIGSYCRIPVSTNIAGEDISTGFLHNPAEGEFSAERIYNEDNQLTHLKITALTTFNPESMHTRRDTLQIKAGRIHTHIAIQQLAENDADWEIGDDFILDGDSVKSKENQPGYKK